MDSGVKPGRACSPRARRLLAGEDLAEVAWTATKNLPLGWRRGEIADPYVGPQSGFCEKALLLSQRN